MAAEDAECEEVTFRTRKPSGREIDPSSELQRIVRGDTPASGSLYGATGFGETRKCGASSGSFPQLEGVESVFCSPGFESGENARELAFSKVAFELQQGIRSAEEESEESAEG